MDPTNIAIASLRQSVTSKYGFDDTTISKTIDAITASPHDPSGASKLSAAILDVTGRIVVPELEPRDFSAFSPDPGIRRTLIEVNLDAALRYLQACVALKNEFGTVAKLYIDSSLKAVEFFILDAIHSREIDAKLYENPWLEAIEEINQTQAAVKNLGIQINTALGVAESILSPANRSAYGTNTFAAWANQNPTAPGANDPTIKAALSDLMKKMSDYNLSITQQSFEMSYYSALAIAPQLQAKLDTAIRNAPYFEKDIAFRSMRRAVSQTLAYKQLDENTRPSSILNYEKRLSDIRSLFEITLDKLVVRVLSIRSAARDLYGIDTALVPPVRGELVNYLSQWLLEVQDKIGKYRRSERISIFSISLKDALSGNISHIANNTGAVFGISNKDTSNRNGLLRGVGFDYAKLRASATRPLSLNVRPPDPQPGAGTDIPLVFGRVLSITDGLELRPQYSEVVWNDSPYGSWNVLLPKSYHDEVPNLADVFMYLWLALPS
jgi:hypothetical protein